jgi:hypothetical protein
VKEHSETSLRFSCEELLSIGIVEARLDKNNEIVYRINPVFIPKIYELLEKWMRSN